MNIELDIPDDQTSQILIHAYARMLLNKAAMLDGIDAQEQADLRRKLYINSLILGTLSHLHDLADDEANLAARIESYGSDFSEYAERLVSQMSKVFSKSDQFDGGERTLSP